MELERTHTQRRSDSLINAPRPWPDGYGELIDSKLEMTALLQAHYTAIRACHATNTADVDAYYRHGLLPLDPGLVHDRARSIFLDGSFPELTEQAITDAIVTVGHSMRAGKVFFETNEHDLVTNCGHYLLYGSEYLTAIAAHLPRDYARDYRQTLKDRGRPTVFVCDVPLRDAGGDFVHEMAGNVLEMLFQQLLDGSRYRPDPNRGAGFSIEKALPPDRIVGHYHPHWVRDPLR